MRGQDFKDFFMIRTRKKKDLYLGTGECTHSNIMQLAEVFSIRLFITCAMINYIYRLPHI